jgi:transposase
MAKPYSDDFRQKVMQAIELDGLKKSEASQLFNIYIWVDPTKLVKLVVG